MASSELVKVDGKGRVLIPGGFRDFLRLKGESEVVLSLDEESAQIILTPAGEKQLVFLKIGISDAPGSLAKVAQALADAGIDLVSTESRSVARGKRAEWRVVCSAGSAKNLGGIRRKALKAGATGFSAKKL